MQSLPKPHYAKEASREVGIVKWTWEREHPRQHALGNFEKRKTEYKYFSM